MSGWPYGVFLIDPQGVANPESALRVARAIAEARPQEDHYTDPWIIAPAPKRGQRGGAMLLYRTSWKSAWEGHPAFLVRKVQAYYRRAAKRASKDSPKF